MNTKICAECGEEKSIEDGYYKNLLYRCKSCHLELKLGDRWTQTRQWVVKNWNLTHKQWYEMPRDLRRKRTSIAREAIASKVLKFVPPKKEKTNIAPFSYPPEHEIRLRQDGRTTESAIKARKANRNGGFDYVMEHPAWPDIRKIGWTYDPPSRLSDFNVCCPYKSFSFPYISVYLEDARLAESIVQNALKKYHVTGEWYRVSRELAIKTIEDYVESLNDRKKQEMG